MKKTIAFLLALIVVLALIPATVLAVELPAGKITVTAQTIDYADAQRGVARPVSKAYVANERFAVLVSINVPGWLDTDGLNLEVTPKNCTIDNVDSLALTTGDYLLTGTTIADAASIKITIKDNALYEASTPNEILAALYNDRTVSTTVTLGASASTPTQPITGIPKTGGRESIGGAALCLLLAAALMWRRKHA